MPSKTPAPPAKTPTKAPAPAAKQVIVAIKVKFELNTPDRLRRVSFGLEKDTQGDDVTWKINFKLFEREKKTDDFGDPIVSLDVEVDKTLNNKAEKAALSGLTTGQSAHAVGTASEDAKAAAEGEIDEEDAKQSVQNTLKKK